MSRYSTANFKKLSIISLVIIMVSLTIGVQADGDEQLNQIRNYALKGGSYVVGGVGLRGVGQGNITLSRIPANANIVDALLYWATIGSFKYLY